MKNQGYSVLTIYMGKPEIQVGKSNGPHHFIWEASENMGCDLRRHHFKYNSFIFLHKISTQVVCVKLMMYLKSPTVSSKINQSIRILLVILYYYMRNFCNWIGLEHSASFEIPKCDNYKPFAGSSINK